MKDSQHPRRQRRAGDAAAEVEDNQVITAEPEADVPETVMVIAAEGVSNATDDIVQASASFPLTVKTFILFVLRNCH